ncbi:MAG: contractile injection system protein, VgrG/Pvc8 family [Clostridia bacterium]|nr:contractile injection system protein, VgrG/Pvc8 family [Clostridia bacterium]
MNYKIGDSVTVTGKPYYTSYGGKPGNELTNYNGKITHINDKDGVPYPIHVDQKGWFALTAVSNSDSADSSSNDYSSAYDKWAYNIADAKKKARRTSIICVFQGKDITKDIEDYLLSFDYTDNAENTADDINITLDDRDMEWLQWISNGNDINVKGAEIACSIVKRNYNNDGKDEVFDCGTFEVDTINPKGFPKQIIFKASAISETSTLRTVKSTKSWEAVTLEEIATEIALKSNFVCKYYSVAECYYERVEQQNESDMQFLSRLCKAAMISLKVSNKAIILFEQSLFEQKDAIMTVTPKSDIIDYNFNYTTNDTEYSKCTVKYTNPKTKKTIQGSYEDKSIKDGKSFSVTDVKVSSKAEANALAKSKLKEKNREGNKISFTLPGDFNLVSGVNINVSGFFGFDGKYAIETATHKVTGGYTTSITARKVLSND